VAEADEEVEAACVDVAGGGDQVLVEVVGATHTDEDVGVLLLPSSNCQLPHSSP